MSKPAKLSSSADLKQRWVNLHTQNPQLHARDAARQLKASEAQLIATGCGKTAVRLTGDWAGLIKYLPLLGRVMALTRNEHALHEQQGTYGDVSVSGNMCLFRGGEIDLRVSLAHWHYGFAVRETTLSGTRHSLQFFDRDGSAVHKIYLTDESDLLAYEALTASYRGHHQSTIQDVKGAPPASPLKPDREIDAESLRADWDKLREPHEFFAMLHRFGVTYLQALRLVGNARAWRVATTSLRLVLESASDIRLPIRIKVDNPGALQIYTGLIHNPRPVGQWYSVLGADFNLHVREAAIESAWVVRRPTLKGAISGAVTSLELFDQSGNTVACLLGRPKPGIPEDLAWRSLLNALPSL
jgi:putative hemin transport protein